MTTTWATLEDVRAKLTYEAIDTDSHPSADEVQNWLDEAHAVLRLQFSILGIETDYPEGDALYLLRAKITDGVVGLTREAWASANGEVSESGQLQIARFQAWVKDVMDRPAYWAELLQGTNTAPATSLRLSSHVTASPDGLAEDDSVFDPSFARGDRNF